MGTKMGVKHLDRGEKLRISRARSFMVAWFEEHGRNLPWRSPSADTFQKICVEVLLQRTRAETVARFYSAFFARFGGWEAIAHASREELEICLKPIGLWSRRAASLQGLAAYAAAHGGIFPRDARDHANIPGVGQYVSNAILLFQYGKARPLLDSNMARVLERLIHPRALADIRYDPWLQDAATWLARHDNPEIANWAVLDYAALICTSRNPSCSQCGLRRGCSWFQKHGTSVGNS